MRTPPKIPFLTGWCSTPNLLRPFARHLIGKMVICCSCKLITIRTSQLNVVKRRATRLMSKPLEATSVAIMTSTSPSRNCARSAGPLWAGNDEASIIGGKANKLESLRYIYILNTYQTTKISSLVYIFSISNSQVEK